MTPNDVVKPWRLIAGIPALLYGSLLLLELPQSSTWLLLVVGVLVVAVADHLGLDPAGWRGRQRRSGCGLCGWEQACANSEEKDEDDETLHGERHSLFVTASK